MLLRGCVVSRIVITSEQDRRLTWGRGHSLRICSPFCSTNTLLVRSEGEAWASGVMGSGSRLKKSLNIIHPATVSHDVKMDDIQRHLMITSMRPGPGHRNREGRSRTGRCRDNSTSIVGLADTWASTLEPDKRHLMY
jgi:hypothetical protein